MIPISGTDGSELPNRNPRALVVDDSALIREVARVALGSAVGWDVTTAASGPEAIEAARSGQPDVILLDVVMPDMDGPRTLARLRQDPDTCEIPVIFATAMDRPDEQAELAKLGADGVISKPYDLALLAQQLTKILAPAR